MLVAISIPIFTSQLEKSREAADAANLRAAYAVAATAVLNSEGGVSAGPVTLKQNGSWEYVTEKIGGAALPSGTTAYVNVGTDGSTTITGTATTGYTVVDPINGSSS